MKLFKKAKKGFTLIELVVVIAVIAILAAISVISYLSITNKAKESNDHMVIDQINTSLLSSQILEKKATVHEIVERFDEEEGYDVRTIKPELKNTRFVYSYEKGKFGYWKDNKVAYPEDLAKIDFTDSNDLWFFEDEAKATYLDDSYSHYLKSAGSVTSITAKGGIDVGECTTISSINLTRTTKAAKDVVIRTNGGTLTVNAPADTVKHYGDADSVNIVSIASASYHENGTVSFLEVAGGHIVLEKDSDVSAVHFDATNGIFENADGKKISVDLSNVPAENLPSFSRDAVTIAENGTYVAEVTTDGTEYVWLFGNGIKEQMVVTTTEGAIAENGALKTGITAGAEDGSVAEQIANPAKRNEQGQLVDNDNNPVTVENAVVEEVASKEDVQAGATLFGGGSGTENDPFIISTSTNFSNISSITKNEKVWYKLGNNITYDVTGIGNYYYVAEMINGDLDLNGKTLSITTENTNMIIGVGTYAKVHNGTINMNGDVALFDEMDYSLQATLVVDSVDFTGSVTPGGWGPHYGIIDCYAGNTSNNKTIVSTVIINNVNSWVTIKANSTCIGGLLGYCLRANVSITNTNVYSYIETGYGAGGIIMSDTQVCGYEKDPSAIAVGQTWGTVENVKFYGNILVPDGKNAFYFGHTVPAGQDSDYAGSSATLVKGINIDNDILVAENGEFKINASANYTKYVVRYSFSVDYIDDRAGGYPRVIEKEFLNDSNQVISTELYKNKVKEGTFNSNTDTYVTDGSNGVFTRAGVPNTYFYDGIGTYKLSKYGVTVTVYAYNGDSLKAVGSYSYPKD